MDKIDKELKRLFDLALEDARATKARGPKKTRFRVLPWKGQWRVVSEHGRLIATCNYETFAWVSALDFERRTMELFAAVRLLKGKMGRDNTSAKLRKAMSTVLADLERELADYSGPPDGDPQGENDDNVTQFRIVRREPEPGATL